jgi:hypothetical protein
MINTTLIAHFYNEEYLLPWWLNHHKDMFSDGILIDYNSTDRSVEIIKEICPHWKIVKSKNEWFEAIAVDEEVMEIENSISGWKFCLNITEFFCYNNNFLNEINKTDNHFFKNYTMIDKQENIKDNINYENSLLTQKPFGFNFGSPYYHVHFNRNFARKMHNMSNGQYGHGRHYDFDSDGNIKNWKNNYKLSNNAAIFWFCLSPFTENTLKRKTQIKLKRTGITWNRNAGGHHDTMTEEGLTRDFFDVQKGVVALSSEIKKFQHTLKLKDFV